MGKKAQQSRQTASNIAAPAVTGTRGSQSSSAIVKSAFAPSSFQLTLFASVVNGLDAQHLRIHDRLSGRVKCDHALAAGTGVTCLDWGYYGQADSSSSSSSRKRKRTTNQVNGVANGADHAARGQAVLAYGTTEGEIDLFSPAEARVLASFAGGHTQAVQDFKFAPSSTVQSAWSAGADGRLVEWNVETRQQIRSFTLPHGPSASILPLDTRIACSSHQAYFFDPSDATSTSRLFNASTNTVRHIIGRSQSTENEENETILTAADTDHFMTVFDQTSAMPAGSLRTRAAIADVSFETAGDLLTIVNTDGHVELFPAPFDFSSASSQDTSSIKARLKQRSRKAAATLQLVGTSSSASTNGGSGGGSDLYCIGAQTDPLGDSVHVAWVQAGVDVVFDSFPVRDTSSGKLVVDGHVVLETSRKSANALGAELTNGVKDMRHAQVNDASAVIRSGDSAMAGADVIDISSQESDSSDISSSEEDNSDDDDDDDDDGEDSDSDISQDSQEDVAMADADSTKPGRNGKSAQMDGEDEDSDEDEDEEEEEEPTFGELLRANAPSSPIDVMTDSSSNIAAAANQSLVPSTFTNGDATSTLTSSSSNNNNNLTLTTLLTQSLRTNDTALLESCLHTKSLATIRATIERLDSVHATDLLSRLAERLHTRPGRAGSLMVWIQWVIVAHGGYVASQPHALAKLADLYRAVSDRAGSLPGLLALKGRLDMLEAQMNLRVMSGVGGGGRSGRVGAARGSGAAGPGRDAEEEDYEGKVTYVEGVDDEDSEDDEGDEDEEDEEEEDDDEDAEDGIVVDVHSAIRDAAVAKRSGRNRAGAVDDEEDNVNFDIADNNDEDDEEEEDSADSDDDEEDDEDVVDEARMDEGEVGVDYDDVDTDSSEDDDDEEVEEEQEDDEDEDQEDGLLDLEAEEDEEQAEEAEEEEEEEEEAEAEAEEQQATATRSHSARSPLPSPPAAKRRGVRR